MRQLLTPSVSPSPPCESIAAISTVVFGTRSLRLPKSLVTEFCKQRLHVPEQRLAIIVEKALERWSMQRIRI
jgi:hypothetical protein